MTKVILAAAAILIPIAFAPQAHADPVWPQCVTPQGDPCPPLPPGCVQDNGMPCSGAPSDLEAG